MTYHISALAKKVGLSRTTLLYYEKRGLIKGKRLDNGYRIYDKNDEQRLLFIQQLRVGGLTLTECQACLDFKINRQTLANRLSQLDADITQKQQAKQLLLALLGDGKLKEWHENIDKLAPDVHLDWLIKQGFNEKDALRLKWLSKDMNEHEHYMADFNRIYESLDRWGPGTERETLKALSKIPFSPKRILDIGCGKGAASIVLAQHTSAQITAVDNEPPALKRLVERAKEVGRDKNISTTCASMRELPFDKASFDIIWSEASAYIMGITNAFKKWRSLLEANGVLVISDLVWLTPTPSKETADFWEKAYADMTTIEERIEQAEAAGFKLLDTYTLSQEAWDSYYAPLQERIEELKDELQHSAALHDIHEELSIYHNYLGEFGYQMLVLQKT